MSAIPWRIALASPIDYSKVSDETLLLSMRVSATVIAVIVVIGAVGWLRYWWTYQPSPGAFSPWAAFWMVGGLVAGAVLFAISKM